MVAISNFLAKENYLCELAENYAKTDERIEIYEYDILLLDITLPDGNGLDMLKNIKKHQKKVYVNFLIRMNVYLSDILIGNLFTNAADHNHNITGGMIKIFLKPDFLQICNTGENRALTNKNIFSRFISGNPNQRDLALQSSDRYVKHITWMCSMQ